VVLNGLIVNGVLTPCGWPAAPSLELSLYRRQAVDFGLQAGEGVGGEIVVSASSWHSGKSLSTLAEFENYRAHSRPPKEPLPTEVTLVMDEEHGWFPS
jgi:hypothetical protein